MEYFRIILFYSVLFSVSENNLMLNNAWANGAVLRPFLQPESPLSSQEFGLRLQVPAPGFKLMTLMLEVERSNPLTMQYPLFLYWELLVSWMIAFDLRAIFLYFGLDEEFIGKLIASLLGCFQTR